MRQLIATALIFLILSVGIGNISRSAEIQGELIIKRIARINSELSQTVNEIAVEKKGLERNRESFKEEAKSIIDELPNVPQGSRRHSLLVAKLHGLAVRELENEIGSVQRTITLIEKAENLMNQLRREISKVNRMSTAKSVAMDKPFIKITIPKIKKLVVAMSKNNDPVITALLDGFKNDRRINPRLKVPEVLIQKRIDQLVDWRTLLSVRLETLREKAEELQILGLLKYADDVVRIVKELLSRWDTTPLGDYPLQEKDEVTEVLTNEILETIER
ncbi:hypothetical protein DRN32_03095 [Thermococci archaeon]|nr:MAG: hypothetical protein DRN32_03095 [Thermococci archaeon]HDO75288.1 hypothetical protein [Candidatus Poribacteria bacterium]HEX28893.1 hypothetical protein [Candidatus Poribacteria bacterium]